jgi:hypothetical protein
MTLRAGVGKWRNICHDGEEVNILHIENENKCFEITQHILASSYTVQSKHVYLKYEIHINTEPTSKETSHFHYKDQSVNAVWGNNPCLFADS